MDTFEPLDRDDIEIEILRVLAIHYYLPLVSTHVSGGCCSFNENEVRLLQSGGFTMHHVTRTLDEFNQALVEMLDVVRSAQPFEVPGPLYSAGKEVCAGLFLYYRENSGSLYGVYVRSKSFPGVRFSP